MDKSFSEIIKVGEILEECLTNGSIISLESLQTTNKASQSGGTAEHKKKKEMGTAMATQPSESILSYQTPPDPPTPTPYPTSPYPLQPPMPYRGYYTKRLLHIKCTHNSKALPILYTMPNPLKFKHPNLLVKQTTNSNPNLKRYNAHI